MGSSVPLQVLAAAIAWCAIVVPSIILRYMSMPEKLFELGSKREVDLVVSNVMSNEVMPSIVELIEKVVLARDDKKANNITVVYEEILEEVDFRPQLEATQKALAKITEIHSTIDRLTDYSTPIWQIGMVHLMIVVGVAVDYLFAPEAWRVQVLWVLITAAALTLVLMLGLVVRFERRHRHLFRHLRINRAR
jgi:hypothetical protein